jgi:hypothetical protein
MYIQLKRALETSRRDLEDERAELLKAVRCIERLKRRGAAINRK